MGFGRVVLLALGLLALVVLSLSLGLFGLLIGSFLLVTILLVTSRRRTPNIQRSMSLRRFISLLEIVALIAILYSPSSLQFKLPLGGSQGTGPTVSETFTSMSQFITLLQSQYHVIIANSSSSLEQALAQKRNEAYFLIGPDEGMNLTASEANMIKQRYLEGNLSLLLSEGNTTNNAFLSSLFDVTVKGDAILDHESNYTDQRVFTVTAHLDSGDVKGLIDVASPIMLGNSTTMKVIASSSPNSTETEPTFLLNTKSTSGTIRNLHIAPPGPKPVIASSEWYGSRAILITDSAPFSTQFNYTRGNVNEASFASAIVNWVTRSDKSTTIILDNTHYQLPLSPATPNFPFPLFPGVSLPVGRLMALALTFILASSNAAYTGFLSIAQPFMVGLALLTAWSIYGTMTTRYATERKGKDDEPLPKIEKTIMAESRERRNFLETSRSKGFYVASLEQLYEVLDSIVFQEFGTHLSSLTQDQISSRLNPEYGQEADQLFTRLSKIAKYARGEIRFLFPPILRWKSTTSKLTKQAEDILNELGLTMAGAAGEKKQLEYKLRRG